MAATVTGPIEWSGKKDSEGHTDFNVTFLVKTDSVEDGPRVVMDAEGLYAVGSSYVLGNDTDIWAFCWPDMDVSKHFVANEPDLWWKVSQKFSTKPLSESSSFDDPLTQPPRTSGSFIKFTKQITRDKDGAKIASSSHELYNWEVDDNRPTVKISLTLASLPLTTYADMVDSVNSSTLWGLPARCVKLANVSWQRHQHQSLGYYYTVDYDFEINYFTFDFYTWDHGTKKLKAGGTATDPTHYDVNTDRLGNVTPLLLNGSGAPLTTGTAPVEQIFKYYKERNFLLLGIPSSL
jgi:hypothetical protein